MAVRLRDLAPFDQKTREIDNHYHVAMIAGSIQELVQYRADSLAVQRQMATGLILNYAESQETNALLGELVTGINFLHDRLEETERILGTGFEELIGQAEETRRILTAGFEAVAGHLLEEREALDRIHQALKHPYETQVQELVRRAGQALKAGMAATGRARNAEFRDADALLREVLVNPIGRRDAVAWFQLGWLRWKRDNDVIGAEEAFFQSARLGGEGSGPYYKRSFWHLAHMQELLGRDGEAYETIQKALEAERDPAILYDAARHAKRTDRLDEACGLLREGMRRDPEISIRMFREQDFGPIAHRLAALLREETDLARREVREWLQRWNAAMDLIRDLEKSSGFGVVNGALTLLGVQVGGTEDIARATNRVRDAGYIEVRFLASRIVGSEERLLNAAADWLQGEIARLEDEVSRSPMRGAFAPDMPLGTIGAGGAGYARVVWARMALVGALRELRKRLGNV